MQQKNKNNSMTDILTNLNTNVSPVERFVSATAGGALLAYGLKRGGALGTVFSLLGGSLAFRGTTGHCHVYDAMGMDTNQSEGSETISRNFKSGKSKTYENGLLSGKVHVSKSLTINKSPAELYSFWHNF